jgi:hypothetical protein
MPAAGSTAAVEEASTVVEVEDFTVGQAVKFIPRTRKAKAEHKMCSAFFYLNAVCIDTSLLRDK